MQLEKKNLFFQVIIPGRVGIKKNGRRIVKSVYGRQTSIPSVQYTEWEGIATAYIARAKPIFQSDDFIFPYNEKIHAYFEFHFVNRHALPDTSNCIEGPQDVMEAMRIYKNDQQIVSLEAHRIISGQNFVKINLYKVVGGC